MGHKEGKTHHTIYNYPVIYDILCKLCIYNELLDYTNVHDRLVQYYIQNIRTQTARNIPEICVERGNLCTHDIPDVVKESPT